MKNENALDGRIVNELCLLAHVGKPLGEVYLHIGNLCYFLFLCHNDTSLCALWAHILVPYIVAHLSSACIGWEKDFLRGEVMTKVSVLLPPEVALFYARVAIATGQTLEKVLSDALFKLAGELALEALKEK